MHLSIAQKVALRFFFLIFLFNLYALNGYAQKKDQDFEQIKKLLFAQQADWNEGNIDQFMEAYWKSDELQFGGASGIRVVGRQP
ncbi:MAG: hypothetical protein AAF705_04675 [Bacteroidota bacterium]